MSHGVSQLKRFIGVILILSGIGFGILSLVFLLHLLESVAKALDKWIH